jgi:hypothetical protein
MAAAKGVGAAAGFITEQQGAGPPGGRLAADSMATFIINILGGTLDIR